MIETPRPTHQRQGVAGGELLAIREGPSQEVDEVLGVRDSRTVGRAARQNDGHQYRCRCHCLKRREKERGISWKTSEQTATSGDAGRQQRQQAGCVPSRGEQGNDKTRYKILYVRSCSPSQKRSRLLQLEEGHHHTTLTSEPYSTTHQTRRRINGCPPQEQQQQAVTVMLLIGGLHQRCGTPGFWGIQHIER